MTRDPLVGKTLADRFEILERIGEGGTGVVYKAKQLSVDRIVAIKVLGAHVSTDQSWVKRFHNEARAASKLDHPNTVRLIDFGQTREGLLFIAMEFLHGRSLRQEIDSVGRIPPNRALRIVSQICASLSEAHNLGIIHRDIKPDNVHLVEMKGAGDYVKVLDFSIAKVDAPDAQVTRAGVVFGTPQYMSPEQGRGQKLDARSDIYAVGIVAYEMLTGKPPFDAPIPTDVVMMHLKSNPAPIQGLPAPVAQLVMRALEKDPARRQQSAEELDAECQQCLADLYPAQTPVAGLRAPTRPPVLEQRTMMAAEAPRSPEGRMSAPPPEAPPKPAGNVAEQRTMMAMEAPGVPSKPKGKDEYAGGNEQRTVMAMEAPRLGNLLPPPEAPPLVTSGSAQKTMMAQAAPLSAQKTMIAQQAPAVKHAPQGTSILPDSQGVVAYAAERAYQARHSSEQAILKPPPAGALFWLAWIVLGIGAGIGAHYYLALR